MKNAIRLLFGLSFVFVLVAGIFSVSPVEIEASAAEPWQGMVSNMQNQPCGTSTVSESSFSCNLLGATSWILVPIPSVGAFPPYGLVGVPTAFAVGWNKDTIGADSRDMQEATAENFIFYGLKTELLLSAVDTGVTYDQNIFDSYINYSNVSIPGSEYDTGSYLDGTVESVDANGFMRKFGINWFPPEQKDTLWANLKNLSAREDSPGDYGFWNRKNVSEGFVPVGTASDPSSDDPSFTPNYRFLNKNSPFYFAGIPYLSSYDAVSRTIKDGEPAYLIPFSAKWTAYARVSWSKMVEKVVTIEEVCSTPKVDPRRPKKLPTPAPECHDEEIITYVERTGAFTGLWRYVGSVTTDSVWDAASGEMREKGFGYLVYQSQPLLQK